MANNTTRLYQQLRTYLSAPERPVEYFDQIQNKMSGIFDIKEVAEYKYAIETEPYTPSQFKHLTSSMKRAFVEGYLLAQMEQSREEIRTLYKLYRQEECPIQTNKDVKIS